MRYAETERFWNAQFDMHEAVPDFAAWQDRHEALSAEADRLGAPKRIELAGVPATVWSMANGRRSHAVVLVTGLNWHLANLNAFTFVAETAAAAKATLFHVDYRTMPEARLADAVDDVVEAVEDVLRATQKVVLLGYCAGAHLIVEASIRCTARPFAAVAVSGLYDLEPLRHAVVGDEIALTREEAAAFSPLARAKDISCPLHLFVGADETPEHRRQSVRMFEAARDAGKTATLSLVPRRHHASIVADLADTASSLSRLVQRLLD